MQGNCTVIAAPMRAGPPAGLCRMALAYICGSDKEVDSDCSLPSPSVDPRFFGLHFPGLSIVRTTSGVRTIVRCGRVCPKNDNFDR
ncbi:hypothetical protein JZ751_009217 [Albula glossodonta]|uniref:Uncharacterized protein n=1 Tax=Albula glossodonta TaxID=121402 RepID=A0A8T2N1T1_9TELE|nr:hypothetical protein JZ751_009217 [Albula glossodonta]